MPREFSLLGQPVDHSLSPRIHGAAFAAWGVDDRYVLRPVQASELDQAVLDAAARGGGNVTLPHKQAVARLLDRPTDAVRATGACNCFWKTPDGHLAGDNTDVGGFIRALEDFGLELSGSEVLVLGAGGAARAVLQGLHRLGVAHVDVWGRTESRVRAMVEDTAVPAAVLGALPSVGDYLLVVNATRLGLDPSDPLPVDLSSGFGGAAFDLVYTGNGTTWVRHAAALGIPATDGLGMLVHQAALSLRRWFPDREPPVAEMFAAVAPSGS